MGFLPLPLFCLSWHLPFQVEDIPPMTGGPWWLIHAKSAMQDVGWSPVCTGGAYQLSWEPCWRRNGCSDGFFFGNPGCYDLWVSLSLGCFCFPKEGPSTSLPRSVTPFVGIWGWGGAESSLAHWSVCLHRIPWVVPGPPITTLLNAWHLRVGSRS